MSNDSIIDGIDILLVLFEVRNAVSCLTTGKSEAVCNAVSGEH